MTSDEANTPAGAEPANPSAGSSRSPSGARSSGRGRYSRGRRRPRRSSNRPPPRRSEEPPEAAASEPAPGNESERRDPLPPPFQPAKVESIQAAIEKVTVIIGELRDVLNDMELVLEYLEDAERQQIADEREIESLQQRLNTVHRRVDRQPPSRSGHRPSEETTEAPS